MDLVSRVKELELYAESSGEPLKGLKEKGTIVRFIFQNVILSVE